MSTLEERYLSLRAAAAILPGRPHLSTLHRWRTRGVGGVKLVTTKIDGRRFVAVTKLFRFRAAIVEAADDEPVPVRTAKRRQAEIEAVEAYLDQYHIAGEQRYLLLHQAAAILYRRPYSSTSVGRWTRGVGSLEFITTESIGRRLVAVVMVAGTAPDGGALSARTPETRQIEGGEYGLARPGTGTVYVSVEPTMSEE